MARARPPMPAPARVLARLHHSKRGACLPTMATWKSSVVLLIMVSWVSGCFSCIMSCDSCKTILFIDCSLSSTVVVMLRQDCGVRSVTIRCVSLGDGGEQRQHIQSVVSTLTNPIGAKQGFAMRSGHHCRPLGGVYPIGDSWQPLESGLNLKQVWMQPPDSCASPSAHPGRANGSSHPVLSRVRLPFPTSPRDRCRSPINTIPETWRPSHQGIARITVKSPHLRPTRDVGLVLLATLVALANPGICCPPGPSRRI